MRVLVIGSGGREHVLAFTLKKSPHVERLFWTPGNAAAEEIADNPNIPINDFQALLRFAKKEKIDLSVVGPEEPLVRGIADLFEENGLAVFGPGAAGARIEGSKVYAKQLMREMKIPTAEFSECDSRASAQEQIKRHKPPYVIKADGLAAGKGVVIAQDESQAEEVLHNIFEGHIFAESGKWIVIEDYLRGEEATVLALCDGKDVLPLISSQDHKPIFDGDKGPNTGGMGAIAPAPLVNEKVMMKVMDEILLPLVQGLNRRGIRYKGVIYVGLMIHEERPLVLEFNCRFGDPEAEAVLPLLDSDLCELIHAVLNTELKNYSLRWKEAYSCDVVLASGGYPGSYEKGKEIKGLDRYSCTDLVRDGVYLFHAGTKKENHRIVTDGGRVLNVVALGSTLDDAILKAYSYVKQIHFEDMFYRKDIGFRGLRHV